MASRSGAAPVIVPGHRVRQRQGQPERTGFIAGETANNHVPSGRTPSAETGLHTLIYRLYPTVGAILHTHSVNATVLSRVEKSEALVLQGYEMQKSLSGQKSHLDSVSIPIFDNDQDIPALAARVAAYAEVTPLQYGFLVRGHGLYCWGKQVEEARRHLEGLEFLFQCDCNAVYWRPNDPRHRDRY
ncbi:hypothetical protein HA402_006794 [Bradysia odoriphaga]|nr:hypothetical protein HA402_006794 [Bradysia odoriphaga]